jgi:hypothetical protein
MTPYDEFKQLSDQICQVNSYLVAPLSGMSDSQRRPTDRVNDAALIVFHVFAFEDFCRHYVSRRARRKGCLHSRLLGKLAWEAEDAGRLSEAMPRLEVVDGVTMIRDLCAHGLGRRKHLAVPRELTPAALQRYGFETDDREDSLDARWWPKRCVAFAACVSPLVDLARWIADNLAVQQQALASSARSRTRTPQPGAGSDSAATRC